MNNDMQRAWKMSLALHAVLFLLMYFGLPSTADRDLSDPQAVSVEILTIADITNVMPAPKPPARPVADTEEAPAPPAPEIMTKSEPLPEVIPEMCQSPLKLPHNTLKKPKSHYDIGKR